MIIGAVVRMDPEERVPVFRGRAAWCALFALYGLPNTAPSRAERAGHSVLAIFKTRRSLFVDDRCGGRPVALWIRS